MMFGLWARIRPRNHVLDGVQIPMGSGNQEDKERSIVNYGECSAMSYAKTAEPIEMPCGLRIRVGPGNHVLDGGSDAS